MTFLYVNTDPRFVGTTYKFDGSPHVEDDNLDDKFKHVALRRESAPAIDIPSISPKRHLELRFRMPPYPDYQPFGTPIKMVITVDQPLNTTVCETPGLILFTNDKHDKDQFRECPIMEMHTCEFLCTCYPSLRHSCMLYVRIERPVYGKWGVPSKIKGIRHTWKENYNFPELW